MVGEPPGADVMFSECGRHQEGRISQPEEREQKHGDSHTRKTRLGTVVRDVVCPREQWLANAGPDKDFLTSPIEWEIKIAAYEVM